MMNIRQLLRVADCYLASQGIEDKTLSFRVFGDSKKLLALRTGSDITTGRFNAAMLWFSSNWPEALAWPDGIERPEFADEPGQGAQAHEGAAA